MLRLPRMTAMRFMVPLIYMIRRGTLPWSMTAALLLMGVLIFFCLSNSCATYLASGLNNP